MWRDYALRFRAVLSMAPGTDELAALAAARTALERRGVGLFSAFLDIVAADRLLDQDAPGAAALCLEAAQSVLGVGRESWAAPEALRVAARLAAARGDILGALSMASKAIALSSEGGLWSLALKSAVLAVELSARAHRTPDLDGLNAIWSRIDPVDGLPGRLIAEKRLRKG
jgi:hypothetical protein